MSNTSNERHVVQVIAEDIDPRLRIFRFGRLVDSFAVVTQRFVVVVDTMVNLETAQEVLAFLSQDLTPGRSLLVVNTHGDWDHTLGNGLFAGSDAQYPAPIIAHRVAAERMRSPEAAEFLAALKSENPGEFDSAENWPPNVLFEGTVVIDGGDLTLLLFPTPGHQRDHVSVWIPEIRILLAGDAAELPMPLTSDWRTLPDLRRSLHRMNDLGADRVLYCHAGDVRDPALIGHNIRYFDELEERCRLALTSGAIQPDVERLEDPVAAIGWHFEDALPPIMSLDDLPPPEGHTRAIRAMLQWIQGESPSPAGRAAAPD
jgi:glyoxylase-like metal-dependent hydrolase (beta-lactamase superfamily II)